MRRSYILLFFCAFSLAPLGAKADGGRDNYFTHYDCSPDKSELIIKTYVSPNEAAARPRDDLVFDQWAPMQTMFACPFDNGNIAYFEMSYGGDQSPHRLIFAFINSERANEPVIFASDRAESLKLTAPYGHANLERTSDFAFKSYSDSALDAMEAEALKTEATEENSLHEDNERLANRKDPGAYGWGAQYKDLRSVSDSDKSPEWGKNVAESADGSLGGVYNWGVLYKSYKERDPMYGSGPWGWGPAVYGSTKTD